ncbi:YceD family protein [Caenimonas aquaedulcis]|uniref:Large ribosomal RNA subunit accumulation protein YceD n=1 Tax=Caenimonas aquaedulcis TaxID=2793270 RepID=A0A931H3G6_9BURK|nr:YceD family protein [Caenimonas aquaedulcis]MBG9387895.1 DUF177 domain-containing protein [Caenimonas aquaedulcis]
MTKEFPPRRLDVKAFAEAGATLRGEEPLARYARLVAETQDTESPAPVVWSATGEMRNPGHVNPEIWLHLEAGAVLALTCQRCLGPVDVNVTTDRRFRFVADENLAAAQDEEAEEDVLALSREFDLLELVEDELLMETPLAPRHDVCPQQLSMSVADEDFDAGAGARENPFAVLGKLKGGST